jgi:hypothetical protein
MYSFLSVLLKHNADLVHLYSYHATKFSHHKMNEKSGDLIFI